MAPETIEDLMPPPSPAPMRVVADGDIDTEGEERSGALEAGDGWVWVSFSMRRFCTSRRSSAAAREVGLTGEIGEPGGRKLPGSGCCCWEDEAAKL